MTDKRNFEIIVDTELPATPERVWEAVTKDTPAWMFPTNGIPQYIDGSHCGSRPALSDSNAYRTSG